MLVYSKILVLRFPKTEAKKPEFGTVVEHVEVLNQRDEVVLVCDHILLANRREKA